MDWNAMSMCFLTDEQNSEELKGSNSAKSHDCKRQCTCKSRKYFGHVLYHASCHEKEETKIKWEF